MQPPSRRPGPLPSVTVVLGLVLLVISGIAASGRPGASPAVDAPAEATTSGDPTAFPATMAADEDPGAH